MKRMTTMCQIIVSGGCTAEQYRQWFKHRHVTEVIVMPPSNPQHAKRIKDGIQLAKMSKIDVKVRPGAEEYLS